MNILTELSTEWLRVYGRANVFVYVVLSKGMPFETVNVVRDKLGLSRGPATFPTFRGDIFVIGWSHGAGWASEYKWGQMGPDQLVGTDGPTLVKSMDFWTTGPRLYSLERSLEVESIGHVMKVELSLLRENLILCILDPVPRDSVFSN